MVRPVSSVPAGRTAELGCDISIGAATLLVNRLKDGCTSAAVYAGWRYAAIPAPTRSSPSVRLTPLSRLRRHESQPQAASGGRISRTRPVEFQFDRKSYTGFVGDTVASALLAAGVRLVGRSFRLHRPRGLLSCGLEEPNGLVHVRLGAYEEPNARATVIRYGRASRCSVRTRGRACAGTSERLRTCCRNYGRPGFTRRLSCGRTGAGMSRGFGVQRVSVEFDRPRPAEARLRTWILRQMFWSVAAGRDSRGQRGRTQWRGCDTAP